MTSSDFEVGDSTGKKYSIKDDKGFDFERMKNELLMGKIGKFAGLEKHEIFSIEGHDTGLDVVKEFLKNMVSDQINIDLTGCTTKEAVIDKLMENSDKIQEQIANPPTGVSSTDYKNMIRDMLKDTIKDAGAAKKVYRDMVYMDPIVTGKYVKPSMVSASSPEVKTLFENAGPGGHVKIVNAAIEDKAKTETNGKNIDDIINMIIDGSPAIKEEIEARNTATPKEEIDDIKKDITQRLKDKINNDSDTAKTLYKEKVYSEFNYYLKDVDKVGNKKGNLFIDFSGTSKSYGGAGITGSNVYTMTESQDPGLTKKFSLSSRKEAYSITKESLSDLKAELDSMKINGTKLDEEIKDKIMSLLAKHKDHTFSNKDEIMLLKEWNDIPPGVKYRVKDIFLDKGIGISEIKSETASIHLYTQAK